MILLIAFTHYSMAVDAADAHMVIVKGKDVSGSVFRRLGLPSQDYCWSQCLKEDRCTATRWGIVEGGTAGQCVLISGPLTFKELSDLKTYDGKQIRVIASRKEPGRPKGMGGTNRS